MSKKRKIHRFPKKPPINGKEAKKQLAALQDQVTSTQTGLNPREDRKLRRIRKLHKKWLDDHGVAMALDIRWQQGSSFPVWQLQFLPPDPDADLEEEEKEVPEPSRS